MQNADLLVLLDAPGAINLFLPSKLIDYLGATRPILGITPIEGSTAKLLQSFGYPVFEPQNTSGIQAAILDLLNHLKDYQLQADALDLKFYTAETIAQRIHQILEQAIENR